VIYLDKYCNFCGKERNENNWCDCEGKIILGKLADLMAPDGGVPISKCSSIYPEWEALWDKIIEVYKNDL
jgi:hypothetical protein